MEASSIILWVVVVILLIWVLYLQFNTVKTSTGFNSYNLSILHSDDGNTDICQEQEQLGKWAHFLRVANKPDTVPWWTQNIARAQLDPNLRWTLEANRVNTAVYILTEGLGVLLSAEFFTRNTTVTRYRVTSGDVNSYAIMLTRPNADNVFAIGLCSYTTAEEYKEHLKQFNYIMTKIANTAGNVRVFVECAIFSDHLGALLNMYALKYGFRYVVPQVNKVVKSLNWGVVGAVEIYRSVENLNWKDPKYTNPTRLADNVFQLQYNRTAGILDAKVESVNSIRNFNYTLTTKSIIANGTSRFSLNVDNINNLTNSTVTHEILTKSPIVQYYPYTPDFSLDEISDSITQINTSLTDSILATADLERRITALEQNE